MIESTIQKNVDRKGSFLLSNSLLFGVEEGVRSTLSFSFLLPCTFFPSSFGAELVVTLQMQLCFVDFMYHLARSSKL